MASVRPASIMIVEDDDEVSESLSFVLLHEGYVIRRFADPQEALACLRTSVAPDLLLLDLMMPVLSGWEFRLLQRGEPQLATIPVIAMSADHSPQAAAIDAEAYLRKPIEPDALLRTIERVLKAAREKNEAVHQAELERLSALGMLAAGIAHEINNPLAVVVGNLDVAQKKVRALAPRLVGPHRDELTHIGLLMTRMDDGARRISEIVRSVSSYSRPNSPDEGAVNVVEVLETSLRLVDNELRHQVSVTRQFEPMPLVRGSTTKLEQVFLNLLANAVRPIQGGRSATEIRVTARTSADGGAEVTIADNGAGIEPTVLTRIFEPFVSSKPSGGSAGLGLAVSHRIIAGMGGNLSAESVPGQGSAFRVSLPAYPQQAVASVPSQAPPRAPERARPSRVLVIDDEPMMCDILASILAEKYEVSVQSHARDALSILLSGEAYDIILCDLMMPELSGIDLHGRLKQARPDQAARMVFMTGGAFTEAAQRFLDGLPDSYMSKPFRPPELIALLERRLAVLELTGSDAQRELPKASVRCPEG